MIHLAVLEKLLLAAEEVLELKGKVRMLDGIVTALTKYVVTVSG